MILERDSWESPIDRPFLVVAYFTKDTPYEQEAEVLKLSLQTLGYSYEVSAVRNLGSWQKNTQLKSKFVRQMMDDYPGFPLLYLDVDAIMVDEPEILHDIDCDIAAVHFAASVDKRGNVRVGKELLSGTVYFAATEAARAVVDRWNELNAKYPETLPDKRVAWDQRTLELAIKQTPSCRFEELPQGYTWITELTQRRCRGVKPVILHTRGAYRFKRTINTGRTK